METTAERVRTSGLNEPLASPAVCIYRLILDLHVWGVFRREGACWGCASLTYMPASYIRQTYGAIMSAPLVGHNDSTRLSRTRKRSNSLDDARQCESGYLSGYIGFTPACLSGQDVAWRGRTRATGPLRKALPGASSPTGRPTSRSGSGAMLTLALSHQAGRCT